MPRFAVNLSWLFTEQPFLDRFGAARRAGFDAVEFRSPYEHPPGEVAEQLRAHSLRCVLYNMPMGDASRGEMGLACKPGREDEFRAGVARAIEYARALSPARINCIAGTVGPAEDRRACEETLGANLRYAAGELERAGFEMVIEPINDRDTPGFIVPRVTDAARIIEAVGSPNLGLQLDLYHCAMMQDDPSSMLAAHRAIVRHIQFADAPGRGEPGTGSVPLRQLFDTIDAMRYAGWVSAEYRPSKPTEQTLDWMRI